MPTRRTSLALLLASALAATAQPAALTPSDIPNPLRDPASCGRHAPSWICDTASALAPGGGDELEGVLRDIAGARAPYAAAACAPSSGRTTLGHQVAVAIVPRMKLRSGEDAEDGAARFAGAVMDAWGVGQARCDDGVVVFVSVGDRQVREERREWRCRRSQSGAGEAGEGRRGARGLPTRQRASGVGTRAAAPHLPSFTHPPPPPHRPTSSPAAARQPPSPPNQRPASQQPWRPACARGTQTRH